MIISHPHQLVIITPPHTGSRSLNRSLTEQISDTFACYGRTPDGPIDHHTTDVPSGIDEYLRYVVVRHPLDRLVGLWFHLVWWNTSHGDGIGRFRDFVQQVVNDDKRHLSIMYRYSVSDWVGDTKIAGVIHFESLAEELNGLFGVPISLYKTDTTRPQKHWAEFFDDAMIETCRKWAERDMVLGGYQQQC